MRFCVRPTRSFDWLLQRLGPHFFLSPNARGLAAFNEKTGETVGMVAYDNWTDNSAQIHIALDTPIAWRSMARHVFRYPFEEANRGLLIATVASSNLRSLRLTSSVGFKQAYRIKDAVAVGVDYVIFEMRREDCRWVR